VLATLTLAALLWPVGAWLWQRLRPRAPGLQRKMGGTTP
jgi:hypothetical protein